MDGTTDELLWKHSRSSCRVTWDLESCQQRYRVDVSTSAMEEVVSLLRDVQGSGSVYDEFGRKLQDRDVACR